MGLKDDLERARAERPQPVLVDIAVGESLYKVEVKRLDGMEWAAVMADAPPESPADARLGYAASKAALYACRKYGRLLDADDNPVVELDDDGNRADTDWDAVFKAISGVELQAIAATWWALNMGDPNQRVVDLKKASSGGGKTK